MPLRKAWAWQNSISSIFDILASCRHSSQSFQARIDRYTVGHFDFIDMATSPLQIERSIAKIHSDNVGDRFFFGISAVNGADTTGARRRMQPACAQARIIAVDLNQPIRIRLQPHRFTAFVAPRALIESILPEAATLHARVVDDTTAHTRILVAGVSQLRQKIIGMSAGEAERALRMLISSFVDVFGRHARLSGTRHAAARAAMFVQARTYIRTHLSEPDLSVGTLFGALRLPRCTLYRLFEHEGGIAAYIVHSRLRAAADDIANYPDLMLKDIAYGVGFNSASAFSRAFKREFGMTPHYLHEYTANQRAAPRNSGK